MGRRSSDRRLACLNNLFDNPSKISFINSVGVGRKKMNLSLVLFWLYIVSAGILLVTCCSRDDRITAVMEGCTWSFLISLILAVIWESGFVYK